MWAELAVSYAARLDALRARKVAAIARGAHEHSLEVTFLEGDMERAAAQLEACRAHAGLNHGV